MFGKRQLVTLNALILAVLSTQLLIAARPAQAQTETVLYNFCSQPNCSDGAYPQSRLTSDDKGNFYGTTANGGTANFGTVFELSPNGTGGWNETVLYNFTGEGGFAPLYSYVIFDSAGNLYGTASQGGENYNGVVFELSPVGASWTETVLYSFPCGLYGCPGGSQPVNGLIFDSTGNLYGRTTYGGSYGEGTVFELSPSGGSWTEQVIYSSESWTFAGLAMDAAGNIFGLEYWWVFELSPNGDGSWTRTVIHEFGSGDKDGIYPQGTPVLDQSGNLYGTTESGMSAAYGTVYKLTPVTKGKKKGTWTEEILHSFKNLKNGDWPQAGVVLDAAGNIYGITTEGGKYNDEHGGDGTVFELVAPVGKGSYKDKVLWSFNDTDGGAPVGSLILDSAGNLYGTTPFGGSNGYGVVFEVTP
jgi:uncharacterized repeat protein (TIGR03803 family)